jgi:hypothetical protein
MSETVGETSGEVSPEGRDDVAGIVADIAIGELEHDEAEFL